MGCPETSVRNYHYSLPNSPEDRSNHLLSGGSLKLSLFHFVKKKKRMLLVFALYFVSRASKMAVAPLQLQKFAHQSCCGLVGDD